MGLQRFPRLLPSLAACEGERNHQRQHTSVLQFSVSQIHEVRCQSHIPVTEFRSGALESSCHCTLFVLGCAEASERWDRYAGPFRRVVRGSRDGRKSMRFEVRPGDCSWSEGWSDCKNDRERHELLSASQWSKGEYWYHWSLFLPQNYPIIYPVKVALAQFHQKGSHPVWMFQNSNGGYYVDNQTTGTTVEKRQILSDESMRGRWSDVLVHARWTHETDGFFRVYVNGETTPRYTWSGPTKRKGKQVYFKLGIYRSFMSRRSGDEPTQIVFYDHVNRARSCERATRYFDCTTIRIKRTRIEATESGYGLVSGPPGGQAGPGSPLPGRWRTPFMVNSLAVVDQCASLASISDHWPERTCGSSDPPACRCASGGPRYSRWTRSRSFLPGLKG